MTLPEAEQLAKMLMREHGLIGNELGAPDWHFKFDNAVRRFGCCHHRKRTISLSKHLVELNDFARVKNTVLHEIAHALCPARMGHTRQWQQMAKAIGCDGNMYYDSRVVATPKHKYTGHCPNCNREVKAHRRNKSACGSCCNKFNGGRFSAEYLIVWGS